MIAVSKSQSQQTDLDVPMPVSWLSDISLHIKSLREVSDYQAE